MTDEKKSNVVRISAFQGDLAKLRRDTEAGLVKLAAQPRTRKRRERTPGVRLFRLLDEAWATTLLVAPDTPAWVKLLIVLLGEADFRRSIKFNREIEVKARLTRRQKRPALEHLERLGLVSVAWRGNGLAPVVIPLGIDRPNQK